jgi:hypothetical protein
VVFRTLSKHQRQRNNHVGQETWLCWGIFCELGEVFLGSAFRGISAAVLTRSSTACQTMTSSRAVGCPSCIPIHSGLSGHGPRSASPQPTLLSGCFRLVYLECLVANDLSCGHLTSHFTAIAVSGYSFCLGPVDARRFNSKAHTNVRRNIRMKTGEMHTGLV